MEKGTCRIAMFEGAAPILTRMRDEWGATQSKGGSRATPAPIQHPPDGRNVATDLQWRKLLPTGRQKAGNPSPRRGTASYYPRHGSGTSLMTRGKTARLFLLVWGNGKRPSSRPASEILSQPDVIEEDPSHHRTPAPRAAARLTCTLYHWGSTPGRGTNVTTAELPHGGVYAGLKR